MRASCTARTRQSAACRLPRPAAVASTPTHHLRCACLIQQRAGVVGRARRTALRAALQRSICSLARLRARHAWRTHMPTMLLSVMASPCAWRATAVQAGERTSKKNISPSTRDSTPHTLHTTAGGSMPPPRARTCSATLIVRCAASCLSAITLLACSTGVRGRTAGRAGTLGMPHRRGGAPAALGCCTGVGGEGGGRPGRRGQGRAWVWLQQVTRHQAQLRP